jgi:hypothetical protein
MPLNFGVEGAIYTAGRYNPLRRGDFGLVIGPRKEVVEGNVF